MAGHVGSVLSVAIAPDGQTALSGSADSYAEGLGPDYGKISALHP